MGFLSGILRRLLGGLWSKVPVIKERGVQIALLAILYAPVIYCVHYNTWLESIMPKWLFTIIVTVLVLVCETKGHFPGFMCGTESKSYLEEQIKNGRSIPYQKLVDWLGTKRGFKTFSKEWCFWQLVLCKTVWCIPVAFFVGSQFAFAGLCTAFAYNAMFYVKMQDFKNILTSPTNWGEFWQGVLYFYALSF